MAMDTLEKKMYNCEPASLEELDRLLWGTYLRHYSGDSLRACAVPEVPRNIDWRRLRHIRVIGGDGPDPDCIKNFTENSLPQGFYLNTDGTWLLVVMPEKLHLGTYFDNCENVESLWIFNSEMNSMDLTKIPRLKELYIRENPDLGSLELPDTLTGLRKLTIRACSRLTELFGLKHLTQLTTLNLSECKNLTSLPGLEKLTQLTTLNLSECDNLTSLPSLENLTQLTSLNLSFCVHRTSLPGLENLTQLTSLNLSGCLNLTSLPGLEYLTQLTSLDLSWCDNLTSLSGLEHLTQLTKLDLFECKNLTSLPGLENLTQLTTLNLSWCKNLTSLPGLEYLTQLTSLDLSRCVNLTSLPESIRHLRSLRELDLRFMILQELPDWLPEITERFSMEPFDSSSGTTGAAVDLFGTTVEGVDMSIFEQPHEVILKWFEERKAGSTRPLNEVKVVFLGDGEAGKTHTIARLLKDGEKPSFIEFDGTATPGIVIKNKEYDLDGQRIQVHFWDFGGQEILHSMHRMFLTDRTLYVVIINARDDTQDDRARYWLHNIKSFAPGAPVLLVLNKIDQNPNASIDLPDLKRMYDGLKAVVRMSALEYDKNQFNKVFTDALMEQVKALGTHGVLWPAAWLKLKKGLETMQTHYIHGGEYEDLCEESGVEGEREDLLHWFNDLGVSFCYTGNANLEDYVILKPEWLTNAIYILLFNQCKEAKNGIIPRSAIDRMLRKPRKGQEELRRVLADVFYNPQEVNYVMDVIRKFRLSYKIREDAEFIPVLCQRESLPVAEEYAEDPNTLEFTMDYEYLPDNVIHRLMVEMRNDLDLNNVWRTGARFAQKGTSYSAVVKSEGNLLRIFVRSDDPLHQPNTYLHILKDNIDRINADMKLQPPFCEVIYKDGDVREPFDYEDLLAAMKDGETTYRSKRLRRRIPIQDILNKSGRTAEVALDKLRNDLITACIQLQGNRIYWDTSEDNRNTAVRDALRNMGHLVNDQTFQGVGGKKEQNAGELDLEIRLVRNIPWTFCEALNVKGRENSVWEPHLNKLLDNYNSSGLNYLFLLTYVDCDKDTFPAIWNHFREHIRWFDPGDKKYERLPRSFSEVSLNEHGSPNYIRAAKITYDRAGSPTTVCHIFARMGR